MVTVAWPCLLGLQTITHALAHTLPPSRPEHRGALWNPVSRPRHRLVGGVEGGRGGWLGAAVGVWLGRLRQGEGL